MCIKLIIIINLINTNWQMCIFFYLFVFLLTIIYPIDYKILILNNSSKLNSNIISPIMYVM